MNRGAAFVAHVEAPESMQPRRRLLDDPARPVQAAAVRRSALGELGVDPTSMQRLAMGLGIVSPVGLDQAGLAPGTPRASRRGGMASTNSNS